jgi:hypothetical protein
MKKLMVMVAALAMISGSAYAADWNFYGNARVATFINDMDNPAPAADSKNYVQNVQGNSRIGAIIKVSDELSGQFEYGTGVNVRVLAGTWNFGAGNLTVGHFWTPVNWFMSHQAYGGDNGLAGWGTINGGRQDAIQLGFGGFKIAALATYTGAPIAGVATTEVDFPRIEADYVYNFDAGFVKVLGGYQTYEASGATYTGTDVDSYVLGVNGELNLGPAYFKAGIFMGENLGAYSSWGDGYMVNTSTAAGDGVPTITAAGQVQNIEAQGLTLVAGMKANDMLSFQVGYGYAENESDVAGTSTDGVSAYYLQSTVILAPGVFIVPEIGYVDYEKNLAGATESELLYYGLKWQINF